MTTYETEEQQAEALKQWWRENGKSLIAGVVIGIGGIVGWQGWQSYEREQAEAASVAFDTFRASLGRVEGAAAQGDRIIEEWPASTYATLTSLALASFAAEKDDLPKAAGHLQWVIDNTEEPAFVDLARSRLARLKLAQDDAEGALALVSGEAPAGFESIFAELKGDALLKKGDKQAAAEAYDEALATLDEGSLYRGELQMKRDDLGV